MTRCHICERPVKHDRDPYYVKNDPGHYDDERFEVAMGNHLFVRACWSCWMRCPTATSAARDVSRFQNARRSSNFWEKRRELAGT